ncbi:Acetyltransferase (GNAT) domain protein [anaerobic digester metagenome]
MSPCALHTARLELLRGTPDLFRFDLEDRAALENCLDARVPPAWPPEFMDDETLREFIALSSDPGSGFFSFYWVLREEGGRTLVGSGGILRESPERVMIGYALLEEWQGRGLGTEAIEALIEFAFQDPGIQWVVAYTYPDRFASIRVLEKNGFSRGSADGGEPGTIAFERHR